MMTRRIRMLQRLLTGLKGTHRRVAKIAVDAILVVLAFVMAYWIRFEGDIPPGQVELLLKTLPFLLLSSLISFYLFKLYQGLWQYSSVKDLASLLAAHTAGWSGFVVLINLLRLGGIPRSILIIYWLGGLLMIGGVRFSYRLLREFAGFPGPDMTRTLVVGAGDAGEMILRHMKHDPGLGYHPVGLVDDDPRKRHVSIHGVPVLGTTEELPALVKVKRAAQIIIATPSATAGQMRRIVARCEEAGVDFKTVPGPREIINGTVTLSQLRGVKIEDLLERDPVRTDGQRIGDFLTGKVVMVTGAGGSIGQELCRQVLQFKPENVVLFDRSENSLFYLENDLRGRWVGGYTTIVGDVCDVAKLDQVITEFRPSVVFHAAAHKHVPLMELNPEEAIKNNLRGTISVADMAERHQVDCFVLISTDKAVEPVNIMGASKRLAELYVQALSHNASTKFVTVRFGNVLGSNGSVVTLFQKQIARGGPVTVTDPEMTRYFMTISEAVQLILQASAIGEGGEIFVLDMGEPIKVVDMARHLITLSGLEPDQDIQIEFIGRRPGEKMFERLWHDSETPRRTQFDKILVAQTNGHDNRRLVERLREIEELAELMQRQAMYEKIRELIPSYRPEVSAFGV